MKACEFLIVYHARRYRGFYDVILDWIAENLPEHRSRFETAKLPCRLRASNQYRLLIPWLQDPVEAWSGRTYRHAVELGARCDQAGIPIINRVDRLSRAAKLQGSELIRETGLRTPKTFRITDPQAFHESFFGLQFPFFVREDFGHGKQMVRADTPDEARKIPLREFTRPVAVELIDSSSPTDKLYRKYRYVVAGDFGVAHHLQVSHGWITRGRNRVVNDITRSEELNYINAPCGLHPAFQKAKRALGLDFVAFDYSLDHRGMPIIWEANPYPSIHFSKRDLVYRNEAVHRTIAIVVASYFRAAAVDMPSELAAYLSAENSISCSGCLPIADHPVPSWKTPPTRPKTRWPALRFPFFSRRAAAGESNNMARPKAD